MSHIETVDGGPVYTPAATEDTPAEAAPPPPPPPPPDDDGFDPQPPDGPDELGVSSYNLAGGNPDHPGVRQHYGQTHALAADEVVNGGSDMMALHEVHVHPIDDEGTYPDKGQDYNEQVLVHSYLQTAAPELAPMGPDGKPQFSNIELKSVGPDGQVKDFDPKEPTMQYTFTPKDGGPPKTVQVSRTSLDDNGQTSRKSVFDPNAPKITYSATVDGKPLGPSMTISKESLTGDGKAAQLDGKPIYAPADNPITVYSAKISDPNQSGTVDYTMVFGKNVLVKDNPNKPGPDPTYGAGNAVLLGPNNVIKRDGNGKILDDQIKFGPYAAGERTPDQKEVTPSTLGVKVEHEGRDVTFIAAHFYHKGFWARFNDGQNPQDPGNFRDQQYRELGSFVKDWGGENVVVAGDFNSKPGDHYGWFALDSYPSDKDLGLKLTDKDGGNDIDHILVSGNVEATGKTTSRTEVGGEDLEKRQAGGSDHWLVQNTVVLRG